MTKKLQLSAAGYLYLLGNIYFNVKGSPTLGLIFGIVAGYFFIKALMIKSND